ncbi:MAG: methylated-DNA--[protein]-cysteine S-methyltransferase [Cyanobacteria bacterium SIG32]|nr:methylated-DNA--[protein]-cysteine S-methyltransferase [Cyanobacteria bacterium SIG32]
MQNKFYYKSPIGILEIELRNDTIQRLRVVESCSNISERSGYFEEVAKQLDEYFAGKRTKFELNIYPKGTEFQKKVWAELLKISYGKTKSYQEIAEAIGNTNAQRAVGSACSKNSILLIIPCRRVISKYGKLAGFACGLDVKQKLLNIEN